MAFVGSRAELDRANALLASDKLHEGIAALLRAAAAQEATAKANGVAVKFSGGVSCERVLQAALKKLEADPYLALNIPHESNQAVIKKAYRRLALRFHPDRGTRVRMAPGFKSLPPPPDRGVFRMARSSWLPEM